MLEPDGGSWEWKDSKKDVFWLVGESRVEVPSRVGLFAVGDGEN